jgi:hypothetical protein
VVDGSSALWFGASGFEVLDVARSGTELVIAVETTATVVGCWGCGTRGRAMDRRWVTLRDAPAGDVAVLVRWRKRIWACPDPDCEVRTWTELADLAEPRRVLTMRAERATIEGSFKWPPTRRHGAALGFGMRSRVCQQRRQQRSRTNRAGNEPSRTESPAHRNSPGRR